MCLPVLDNDSQLIGFYLRFFRVFIVLHTLYFVRADVIILILPCNLMDYKVFIFINLLTREIV